MVVVVVGDLVVMEMVVVVKMLVVVIVVLRGVQTQSSVKCENRITRYIRGDIKYYFADFVRKGTKSAK